MLQLKGIGPSSVVERKKESINTETLLLIVKKVGNRDPLAPSSSLARLGYDYGCGFGFDFDFEK